MDRVSGVRWLDKGQVRSEARYVLETPASSDSWLSPQCDVAEPGSSESAAPHNLPIEPLGAPRAGVQGSAPCSSRSDDR
jgi:hypothetical protein